MFRFFILHCHIYLLVHPFFNISNLVGYLFSTLLNNISMSQFLSKSYAKCLWTCTWLPMCFNIIESMQSNSFGSFVTKTPTICCSPSLFNPLSKSDFACVSQVLWHYINDPKCGMKIGRANLALSQTLTIFRHIYQLQHW